MPFADFVFFSGGENHLEFATFASFPLALSLSKLSSSVPASQDNNADAFLLRELCAIYK